MLPDIGPEITPRAVIGGKGYSSKANRALARSRGIAPVIPHRDNEKDKPAFFAKTLYQDPLQSARTHRTGHRHPQTLQARRPALRETARSVRSIVSFAAGLCLIKFVDTA